MHRAKADIIFIQETHLRADSITKLQDHYYPTAFHTTTSTSKSKGVSTLLAKNCPFQLTETLADVNGRYLFLKGTLFGQSHTNVYALNSQQVTFFRELTNTLTAFQDGIIILGGDLNVSLNPLQDTSTGTSSLQNAALRAIKSQLQTLLLHDTWRTLNPNGRDFTFFFTPHNQYSRIDYLFLSQNDLSILQCTSIDPMFLSNHHPISMTIALPETRTCPLSWKLDPSLLTDLSVTADVELRIKQYFEENKLTNTSPLITSEAHKCVIRGILMAAAAKRNQEKRKRFLELSAQI